MQQRPGDPDCGFVVPLWAPKLADIVVAVNERGPGWNSKKEKCEVRGSGQQRSRAMLSISAVSGL